MQRLDISSSGWRLPTKDEGKAMADQYEAVCAAITSFGGDDNPASWYWTSTESDASRAYFFSLIKSSIYNFARSITITFALFAMCISISDEPIRVCRGKARLYG